MTDQKLITRTDVVFLPITCFQRAEAFYGGLLGLQCSKRYANALGLSSRPEALSIQLVDVAKIGREFEPSTGARSRCT
jgi:catechol 2,3-dioxygenase-like lactoylglutathione lyase family enzyme